MQVTLTTVDSKLTDMPNEPSRSGYEFNGWWDVREGTSGREITKDTVFDKTQNVYAHWNKLPDAPSYWTITFDPNDGSAPTMQRTTNKDNMLDSIPAGPTRDGYTFDGWYLGSTGGEKLTTSFVFAANRTVYAHWTKKDEGGSSQGTTPVTPDPGTTTTPATYKVIEGANSTWTGTGSLTVRADGDFAKFNDLLVDGKVLANPEHYTAVSGSTVATINANYLNSLSAGSHQLTFKYDDGEVSTNFTVNKAATNPGDDQGSTGNDGTSGNESDYNVELGDNNEAQVAAAGANKTLVSDGAVDGTSESSDAPETGDSDVLVLYVLVMLAALIVARRMALARN